MQPRGTVLNADDELDEALGKFEDPAQDALMVRMPSHEWACLTRDRAFSLAREGSGPLTLGALLADSLVPYVHPDQALDTVLRYVDRFPLVPVVHRADLAKLEGVISQIDVLACYRDFGAD